MNKLNIINIIQAVLPPVKRMPIMVTFLKVLSAPLQSLNNWIHDVYYPDVTRRTKWNAQVLLFSKALNDLHNAGNYTNRIYISTADGDLEMNYFYNTIENITLPIYTQSEELPLYSYNEIEYEPIFDFSVNYPVALAAKAPQIESSVKKYKIAGATYQMKSYA